MIRAALLLVMLVMINGCSPSDLREDYEQTYNLPFIPDGYSSLVMGGHVDMCNELPESIFCIESPSVGDIQPTKAYAVELANILFIHTDYVVTNEWYYNYTVYEDLRGDCEDVAMTIVQHMVDEGIDKKYLHLVWYKTEEGSHLFVAVDTVDAGLIHIDYQDSGGPIEPEINWHMRMDNPGVDKWVKGNIL